MASTYSKKEKQQIKVFVRVRPINSQEREARSAAVVEASGKDVTVTQAYQKRYTFDKSFGPNAKQMDVYKSVVHPLIAEVLAGYNCTVFAYGQTGTGKTHTMAGGIPPATYSWADNNNVGIIPRALAHLYEELQLQNQEYTVRVSYLELYNEELFDLLSPIDDASRIRIYEQKGSIVLQGLEEIIVQDKNQVYKILDKGQEKRRTASTLMNASSSRSHTVFTITVHTREVSADGEELVKTGKLNLVDLAGSENIGKSGAIEMRAREAGNINQSLLTLGRVITALVERAAHVPYRESKLTRILQDSLGGRTKTSIIATVSPAACNLEETMSTLDYAHRARNIMNRPEINQRMSKTHVLSQFTDEIARLRKDLEATRMGNGICLAKDNYDQIIYQLEVQKQEISDKINQIRTIKTEMEAKEEEWDNLVKTLKTAEEQYQVVKGERDGLQVEIGSLKTDLKQTVIKQKEAEHLATVYETSGKELYGKAQELKKVVDKTVVEKTKLHDKVDTFYDVTSKNKQVVMHSFTVVKNSIEKLQNYLTEHVRTELNYRNDLKNRVLSHQHNHNSCYLQANASLSKCLDTQTAAFGNLTDKMAALETKMRATNTELVEQSSEQLLALQRSGEAIIENAADTLRSVRRSLDENAAQTTAFCSQLVADSFELNDSNDAANEELLHKLECFKADLIAKIGAIDVRIERMEENLSEHEAQAAARTAHLADALDAYERQTVERLKEMRATLSANDAAEREARQAIRDDIELIKLPVSDTTYHVNMTGANVIEDFQLNAVAQAQKLRAVHEALESFDGKQLAHKRIFERAHDAYSQRNDAACAEFGPNAAQLRERLVERIEAHTQNSLNAMHDVLHDSKVSHDGNTELLNLGLDCLEKINAETTRCNEYAVELANGCNERLEKYQSQVSVVLEEESESIYVDIADVPKTGETPVRAAIKYPHHLNSSEPRNVVLQKYREQMKEVDELLKSPVTNNLTMNRSNSDVTVRHNHSAITEQIKEECNIEKNQDKSIISAGDIIQSKIPLRDFSAKENIENLAAVNS